MNARPRSIMVIGSVFVVFGCIALSVSQLRLLDATSSARIAELYAEGPVELGLASIARVLAIVGGAFALRGFNWARSLLVAWMGYHVVLSLLHPALEIAVHSLLFAVIVYFLFRPEAAAYFRRARVEPQS